MARLCDLFDFVKFSPRSVNTRLSAALYLTLVLGLPLLVESSAAQSVPTPQYPNYPSETPAHLNPPTTSFEYERRIAMIPMRDGIKLHTVILVPKGAKNAPILLTRTPYNADDLTTHDPRGGEASPAPGSTHLGPSLYGYDNATDVIVEGGYIRVV